MPLSDQFIGKPIRKLGEQLPSASIVGIVEINGTTDRQKAMELIKRSIRDQRTAQLIIIIKL